MKKPKESSLKIFYDYLPLVVFFACYKFCKVENPLITATILMVVTTIFALIISYFLTKKIPMIALFSAAILTIFGSLTVFLNDETFIKIKPTIINSIFASILLYGFFTKKPLLSKLLGEQIKISEAAWLSLSLRWALLFLSLAVINEFIWRNFSTDFWVEFKLFGMMPISVIFTISQLPFMIRETKKYEEKRT